MIDRVSVKVVSGSRPSRQKARFAWDWAASSLASNVLETPGIAWPKKLFPVEGKPCGHCELNRASRSAADRVRKAGSVQFMVHGVGGAGFGAGWRATRSPALAGRLAGISVASEAVPGTRVDVALAVSA